MREILTKQHVRATILPALRPFRWTATSAGAIRSCFCFCKQENEERSAVVQLDFFEHAVQQSQEEYQ